MRKKDASMQPQVKSKVTIERAWHAAENMCRECCDQKLHRWTMASSTDCQSNGESTRVGANLCRLPSMLIPDLGLAVVVPFHACIDQNNNDDPG
jgi:hypothetical protein